jgi:competence protein ComGC
MQGWLYNMGCWSITGYKVQPGLELEAMWMGVVCMLIILLIFMLVVAPKAVKHLRRINNGGITSGE